MIQLLLFSIYVLVMGMLISAVINEPISGVIILSIGVPVTAIYLALAIGGVIISGLSRKNLPEKNGQSELGTVSPPPAQIKLGTVSPPPAQIKLGPVTLQELPSKQKRAIKWIIFLLIAVYFFGLPILEISLNQG